MWNNQGQGGDFNQSFGQSGGFNTPHGDEKKRSTKRGNNIVPVTVAQLLAAKNDDDMFVSGNLILSQVTFVGVVKSVNVSSTRIDYLIDDRSGPPIEAKQFNSSDDGEAVEQMNTITPKTYVRIFGILRDFGGKRSVNAFKITPVEDMNELTCHMLEVVYASAESSQNQQTDTAADGDSSGFGMEQGDNGQIPGLDAMQSQVHNIIRSKLSERGCSIDEICQSLRSVAPKAIRNAVEFLSSEGHIYSTIDDEHFRATDV